jgi:hypothetical protein
MSSPAFATARAATAAARAAVADAVASLEAALRAEARAEMLDALAPPPAAADAPAIVRAVGEALQRCACQRVMRFTKRAVADPEGLFSAEERAVIADYARARLAADATLDAATIACDALTDGDVEVIMERAVSTEVYSTIEPDGTPKFDAPDADTDDDDAPQAKRARGDTPARTVSFASARVMSA